MKNLYLIIGCVTLSIHSFSQTAPPFVDVHSQTVLYFEGLILTGRTPSTSIYNEDIRPSEDNFCENVYSQYKDDYRVIVWNDQLTEGIRYSTNHLKIEGYEFVKSNEDDTKNNYIYRNCKKNILVTITKIYGYKYSIKMEWCSQRVKKNNAYLSSCQ